MHKLVAVKMQPRRIPLSKELRVTVYRHDRWLCHWCDKPVIFAQVLKYLEKELKASSGYSGEQLCYYNKNWRRTDAPLLDLLGAEIDHIDGNKANNDPKNLATSCHKCNIEKGAAKPEEWNKRHKKKPIKSKYGEPKYWDGLSSLFVMLAQRHPAEVTTDEKGWLRALAGRSAMVAPLS